MDNLQHFVVRMFSSTYSHKPQCSSPVVGGKPDRQIYGIDFTFNLRQTKRKKKKGNCFGVALLPQSARDNKNTSNSKSGHKSTQRVTFHSVVMNVIY